LALAAVPLIDNVPGTRYVGIDLPRPKRAILDLRPALSHLPVASVGSLPFLVGQTPDGRVIHRDLAELPHLLVAGTTGSGKTIFLYTLLVSLLHRTSTEALSVLIVDPKQTDFIFFQGLPHLYARQVLTDPEEAIAQLRQLTGPELQSRTERLNAARVVKLSDYNARYPASPLHPIVVVIDEYADLIDVMDKAERANFERELKRLAQRARNVGIHLVVATQRPSADNVTTSLKANLPARIAFRLPALYDSKTILDQPGAENLLGQGDMLFLAEGQIIRLQGFYITPDELSELLHLC
jgi:DNA segregation ATPase FtsK/SpoIIIE-like protein